MSGAGLYDSIPNVKASEPGEFSEAVSKVSHRTEADVSKICLFSVQI